jgi:hypothetical protein
MIDSNQRHRIKNLGKQKTQKMSMNTRRDI